MSGQPHCPTPRPAPARTHTPGAPTGHVANEGNFPDVDNEDHLIDQPDPPPPIPGEGKDAKLPKA